jgi:hypothetical protein
VTLKARLVKNENGHLMHVSHIVADVLQIRTIHHRDAQRRTRFASRSATSLGRQFKISGTIIACPKP